MSPKKIINDKFILSICIPTYNRCNFLSSLLENLVKQIIKAEHNVQICISDNCSSDSTAKFLKEYAEKYSFIKVNYNSINFGYDYNLCRVIDMADGKYIWTFSDDDIVVNGGVNEIVNIINRYNNDLSVIFAKPKFVDKDKISDIQCNVIVDDDSNIKILHNNDDFIFEVSWLVSFVSAFVIKKDYILSNVRDFVGSGFIHTPIIMGAVTKGKISISTGMTIIISRQNNSGGYNLYKYFGTNISHIFNYFKKNGYKESTIKKLETDWLRFCVRGNIVNCKNQDISSHNNLLSPLIDLDKIRTFG